MKPIPFGPNPIIFAESQQPYTPLPAQRSANGVVTSRWKLTLWERVVVFCFGELYISVATFNQPPQPIAPSIKYVNHE